jgi:hypothetical protein
MKNSVKRYYKLRSLWYKRDGGRIQETSKDWKGSDVGLFLGAITSFAVHTTATEHPAFFYWTMGFFPHR